MKIAILAPTHKSFISKLLTNIPVEELPDGYDGAPFLGIIIEELLKQGHEVIVITTSISENLNSKTKIFIRGKFKWVVVPSRKHSIRNNGKYLGRIIDFYKHERKAMREVVIREKPDFVHAHWSYEFAGAVKGLDIPYLITIHDNAYKILLYMTNLYRFGRLLMSEWVLHGTKYGSTVSPYMQKYALRRCKELLIIPNPVKVVHTFEEVKELVSKKVNNLKANLRFVMVMNGWDRLKNGETGLRVFEILKKEYPDSKLHLYGSGTNHGGPAYRSSKYHNINDIVFHGVIPHRMLMKELELSHVMLHPSYEESFGVVLIEAMSSGIPVIGGVKSGAVPWVINNKNLLTDISNANKIADCVVKLLSDKSGYEKTALACYENTINRFSSEAVVGQYVDYYKHIKMNWK